MTEEKRSCANCKKYNECLKRWHYTILSQSEDMKDCVCSHWEQGENEIQTKLF